MCVCVCVCSCEKQLVMRLPVLVVKLHFSFTHSGPFTKSSKLKSEPSKRSKSISHFPPVWLALNLIEMAPSDSASRRSRPLLGSLMLCPTEKMEGDITVRTGTSSSAPARSEIWLSLGCIPGTTPFSQLQYIKQANDKQTNKPTNKHTNTQTNKQTHKQTNQTKQTNKPNQTNKQTNKQTNQTNKHARTVKFT